MKNATWADGSGGGTAITAAKLNNIEAGIFDAHYPAAARVYNSANQSVTTAVAFEILFNSERFDTESNAASTIHDTGSNTGRLTCRTAGKYLITASIEWAANATGYRNLWIELNGTTTIAAANEMTVTTASVVTWQTVTTVYDLAVNDYVKLWAYQTSGGALNIVAAGNYSPEFMMTRVA